MWRRDISIEVGDLLDPGAGENAPRAQLNGFVAGPDYQGPAPATLVYCLVGGSSAVTAFDLQVPGHDRYSLVEFLVGSGFHVAAVDHPGIASATPVADTYEVSVDAVTACHVRAVEQVHAQLAAEVGAAVLPVVGLGHSMGAMFAVLVQAAAHPFERLVVLGHSGAGMPDLVQPSEAAIAVLPRAERPAALRAAAAERFGNGARVPATGPSRGVFLTDDTPAEVRDALAVHNAGLLPQCGLASFVPGLIATEQAAVDVPVLVALGEFDLVGDIEVAAACFTGTDELWRYVVPGSGHNMNASGNRLELWRRIVAFVFVGLAARAEAGIF